MPVWVGQWGQDIKSGPGQCDAAHENGVGEEKCLGAVTPGDKNLLPGQSLVPLRGLW